MWSYVRSGPGNCRALLSETSPKRRLFLTTSIYLQKHFFVELVKLTQLQNGCRHKLIAKLCEQKRMVSHLLQCNDISQSFRIVIYGDDAPKRSASVSVCAKHSGVATV